MTCKRCGCTETTPCPGGCAWILPDLCTSCLTSSEAAIDKAYASLIEGLRGERLFERCLLAVAQGLAANASLQIDACTPRAFVERAVELATALAEAADVDADDEDDVVVSRLVVPGGA